MLVGIHLRLRDINHLSLLRRLNKNVNQATTIIPRKLHVALLAHPRSPLWAHPHLTVNEVATVITLPISLLVLPA
jgi:hypothetical protein